MINHKMVDKLSLCLHFWKVLSFHGVSLTIQAETVVLFRLQMFAIDDRVEPTEISNRARVQLVICKVWKRKQCMSFTIAIDSKYKSKQSIVSAEIIQEENKRIIKIDKIKVYFMN